MTPIRPDWPAPPWVRAACTTREGGVSAGPFASLNLGDHVGDDPRRVAANRSILRRALDLPTEPLWLRQVHGCDAVEAQSDPVGSAPRPTGTRAATDGTDECTADAAIARAPGAVCAVMTADCLPILLCDREGTRVAAVHAGWRGLAAGVIERSVVRLGGVPSDLLAWLGPAIGPDAFEVGPEVRERCLARDPGAEVAFRPRTGGKWLADLYLLARRRLATVGLDAVFGGEYCTASDPSRFYSYRRDGTTGRMASLIWLAARHRD